MTTLLAAPPRPPLVRPAHGRLLSGVAAGTAAHLRTRPVVVRVAFVVLTAFFVGFVAYALLWFLMPTATGEQDDLFRAPEPGRLQTLALAGLGYAALVSLTSSLGVGGSSLVVPLLLLGTGLVVIWRQLDTDRGLTRATERWALAGGTLLGVLGVVALLSSTGQLTNARNGFAATLVILVGIVLATAPLWRRLLVQRATERSARIRSEERASVAAHLHDSVLQTLSLIQRHAADPQQVQRLARSQERELRAWLYEPAVVAGGTWAGAVSTLVADVEADHAVTVESVVVGDAPLDDAVTALGQATREAVVNAAKHSGASSVALYSEVTAQQVSVFVRDRGAGFDPGSVPLDRRGLRDSVVGRLQRHGGTALVRSAPREGTEVELCLPRGAA